MSKFRYRPMSLSASTSRVLMYSSEPTRPSSSAPQKANRTAFLTCGELPSCTAVSSMAATPEPLSLMPGPSGTLSRCAPVMTTSCVDPVLVCAMTLWVRSTRTPALSLTVAGPGLARSRVPSSLLMPTTGMETLDVSPRVPSVTTPSSLLATISATAPRRRRGGLLLAERAGAAIHQHDRRPVPACRRSPTPRSRDCRRRGRRPTARSRLRGWYRR